MKTEKLSVKNLLRWTCIGTLLSMVIIALVLFVITLEIAVLVTGGALILCALIWLFILTQAFGKRLSLFTSELCKILDDMIDGDKEPKRVEDSEALFARISHRLTRLYQIMRENRHKVDEERQELQTIVSDISHQVKTPVSNLKMATDTLLTNSVTEAERKEFIQGIRTQTDRLDFLFQALVKTSRLETGVIRLEKKIGHIYDTVAQAMSGIVYEAEKKHIDVSVSCPENLTIAHDSKWTAEALFNLLDNAVKYTPADGKIAVIVKQWEMYLEIKVTHSYTIMGIVSNFSHPAFNMCFAMPTELMNEACGIDCSGTVSVMTETDKSDKVEAALNQLIDGNRDLVRHFNRR